MDAVLFLSRSPPATTRRSDDAIPDESHDMIRNDMTHKDDTAQKPPTRTPADDATTGVPGGADAALADASGRVAHRRRFDGRRLRRVVIAAAAAAAVITVGTWFGVSRETDDTLRFDPHPATAREVIESTLSVTSAAESIEGAFVVRSIEDGVVTERSGGTFAADADGNIAMHEGYLWEDDGPEITRHYAYLAAEHRLRLLMVSTEPMTWDGDLSTPPGGSAAARSSTGFLQENTQIAAGPPYRTVVDDLLVWRRLRAYLRQLLEQRTPDMREVTVDGRLAWELTTVQNAGNRYDDEAVRTPVKIVIDQVTRLPLAYRWRAFAGRRLRGPLQRLSPRRRGRRRRLRARRAGRRRGRRPRVDHRARAASTTCPSARSTSPTSR